jgi:2-polyprenyl-6-methoxyphenol hydroxylase-like FAD-dependent oxidoreductase
MARVNNVLVVGGGTAGNSLAVLLRKADIAVDLVEVKEDWNASGSGITLQGNALRVLREVGVWDEVQKHGFGFDSVAIAIPNGTIVHENQDIKTGGPDLPATLGMQRPQLQLILMDAVRASGTNVRLGVTVESLTQDADGVDVVFTDGTSGRYDLVVAADGMNSATRAMIGITETPEPTGIGIWRTTAPRPEGLERTEIVFAGPCFVAGYCPTGPDTIYAYLAEPKRDRETIDPATYADEMRKLAAPYGGHWDAIRESITDPETVNYAWFDRHLVEGDWHRGRVVLVGDSAHACPPSIAQGAAMSLEDCLVLAELLSVDGEFEESVLVDYRNRRMPRVRMVVENSVQIGTWQLARDRDADVPGLMGRTMTALSEAP